MLTPVMGSHQTADQMRCVHVNPLINSLMANGLIGVLDVQSARDQFWGPAKANMFLHIAANKVVFKPLALMRLVLSIIGSLLGFVGQVIAFVDWRCIAL